MMRKDKNSSCKEVVLKVKGVLQWMTERASWAGALILVWELVAAWLSSGQRCCHR